MKQAIEMRKLELEHELELLHIQEIGKVLVLTRAVKMSIADTYIRMIRLEHEINSKYILVKKRKDKLKYELSMIRD